MLMCMCTCVYVCYMPVYVCYMCVCVLHVCVRATCVYVCYMCVCMLRVCVCYMCVCVLHVCMCVLHVYRFLRRPKEDVESPTPGVSGGSELPDKGTGISHAFFEIII